MVLESTMICVDNSDYMRNGDFVPTRLQAQQDAVNIVCHSKTRSNPENNIGLLTMSSTEVLTTLTSDSGKILAKLHQVSPKGDISFISSLRIAHLALKHRQGRNHRMRIVVFVGSPIDADEKEMIKLAKRLKKEKVGVDIINFGEHAINTEKLTSFINTINGKDGSGSHLVTVQSGPMLSDALVSSPVVVGEDGTGAVPSGGFEFGIDPNEDPELALALRVSMEEQRARQEENEKKATSASVVEAPKAEQSEEDALLQQAMQMSMQPAAGEMEPMNTEPDLGTMTEEQQIALAMQMSLGHSETMAIETNTELPTRNEEKGEDDYSEVINDPDFLQSVLEGLPGVDPQSEAIRNAVGSLTKKEPKKDDTSNNDRKEDKE